jgi:hypothetical protein
MQADRETMRGDILAELDKRPKAAAKATPAQAKRDESGEDRSTEDVVRAAMASAGMR